MNSLRAMAFWLCLSLSALILLTDVGSTVCYGQADPLAAGFQNPPASAKPLIMWQWMNGVVSKKGITADLEAYKRIGLGGVQNFQMAGRTRPWPTTQASRSAMQNGGS